MKRKITLALVLTIMVGISYSTNVFADSLSQRVNAGSDDAEEIDGGTVILFDGDLELCEDEDLQEVGLRFNNIVIPEGSTIISAYIEFTVQEIEGPSSSVMIFGEDTDNALTFSSSDYDVSSRTKTSASVPWFIDDWNTVGQKDQTPDITSVIQEIVDRGGWSNGNSIAIILTGSGEQVAESYEGDASAAPLLVIDFTPVPEFNKTVNVDTTVAGDTVTYTYSIYNNGPSALSNIIFRDTLKNGLLWASEPQNLTGGITIGITSIAGNAIGDFTIANLPLGTSSFDISVSIPNPYSGSNPYMNQAWLTNLPALPSLTWPSDNPVTPAIDDATPLVILSETDCVGNWNTPQIISDFDYDHLSVDVLSSRPLMNVVLKFYDGATQLFDGLTDYSGTYSGYGANAGKCIIAVWARTACNASGEGPEYGEYIANATWDGLCETPDLPVILVFNNHGSQVILGGGTQVNPNGFNTHGNAPNDNGATNGNGHNSTGAGTTQPGYDPRGGRENLFGDLKVNVFPNPASTAQYISVEGLDNDGSWTMHVFSMNGKFIATRTINDNAQIHLADLGLSSGLYFLEFENGVDRRSAKLVVQE